MRNPSWTRDELILGLDAYFRLSTSDLARDNPQIIALSELLNTLPIHPPHERDNRFRNPAGVAMELRNFLSFDPAYPGKGLDRGSKLGSEIWREFADDRDRLRETADAIRRAVREFPEITRLPLRDGDGDNDGADLDVYPEGVILTRLHRIRERNAEAVRKKKRTVLSVTGRLACEACGFDFEAFYGALGQGYAECHHLTPLAELAGMRETRLQDLAIVCANCHRMLHRGGRWLSLDDLRAVLHVAKMASQRPEVLDDQRRYHLA